jgi:glycerol kinase
MPELVLAIDVGTSAIGVGVFTAGGERVAHGSVKVLSRFPSPGRVEQDATLVWRSAKTAIGRTLAQAGRSAADLAAIGIATQRTSIVVWDRRTGRPLSPMVIWSDLRGAGRALELRQAGFPVAAQQAAA